MWVWTEHVNSQGVPYTKGRLGDVTLQTQRSANGRYMSTFFWVRPGEDFYMRDHRGFEHWTTREEVIAFVEETPIDKLFRWAVAADNRHRVGRAPAPVSDNGLGLLPEVEEVERKPGRRSLNIGSARRGCDNCSLQGTWSRLKHPQMPIAGDPAADILVLGEAPGQEEDREGTPFVGPSGTLLRRYLPHRERDRIALTNAVRCRPDKNRNPTAHELHACSLHLENDIAAGRYKAILGLGSVPLSRFLTGATITQCHGLKFPIEIAGQVLWYYPTVHPAYILYDQRRGGDESPALPILENDILHFFRDVDSWPQPRIERPNPNDVVMAKTQEEARGWLSKLNRSKPLGLDIETNDLRPTAHGAEIMSAAVSDGELAVSWCCHHYGNNNAWGIPLLLELSEDLRWVAHNAGFELAWLYHNARKLGIEWEPRAGFDDSMAIARLVQRRHGVLNLGILTRLYLGTNIKELSTVNTMKIGSEALSDVLRYNGLDAWGCRRVYDELEPRVDRANYQSILDTIASITDMQLVGLDVNQDTALALHEEWQGRAQEAEAHAQTLHEVKRYVTERQVEFRLGSDNQVGDALVTYAHLPLPLNRDGSYKTDDTTLNSLAPDNPLVQDALEFRHSRKMDSTYVTPLIDAPTDHEDGKLHPSYNAMLTRTLRLSSEDPNIQNFPKRKDRELREPVVPPPGCIWGAADFGQLEARIYACASRDRELVRTTIEREDIHSYWLQRILDAYPDYRERLIHKTESDDPAKWRDIIKSDFVFSSFYGSSARNVAERTGMDYDLALHILGEFWSRYHGAAEWLRAQRTQYRNTGMTQNLCGVERYGIMSGNEPINNPIQSTAARLVLDAQNEIHRLSKDTGNIHMLPRINIHDDLVFALPDDDALLLIYMEELSKILTKVRYSWQVVPLSVEWRIGTNWADLHSCFDFVGDYVNM